MFFILYFTSKSVDLKGKWVVSEKVSHDGKIFHGFFMPSQQDMADFKNILKYSDLHQLVFQYD